MNMKTKLLIGGAVLAAGATTYIVVKNAKKKKAENSKSQLSSANKATEVIKSEVLENTNEKEVAVEKKKDEKSNKETKTEDNAAKENQQVNSESNENVKEEAVDEESTSNKEDEEKNEEIEDDKNKLNFNKLFINRLDANGKERANDDKLNKEETATIQAYCELIKGVKSEKEVNKFIEENSTFDKFETYNSELLKHFVDNFVGTKRMTEIEEVMSYVKENIISTNSENDVIIFNRIYDIFNKLKSNKDIYFVYAQDVITSIVKVLLRLRNLVDEVIAEEQEDSDENTRYENEEDIIDSVLRARTEDNDEYSESDTYEDENEYLTSAKREFLSNTRFHYDD